MSNITELIEVIKKREGLRFDSEVATYMGIDRKSLAVAKSRKVIPISYINWYCKHYDIQRQKFEGHLKGSGTKENESEESVEYTIIAQRETIELQKEKIIQLEERVAKYKSTPVQETVWNQLEYDFQTEVNLTFKNLVMGRTILSTTNIELQSKVLGYSISEIENLYEINNHHKRSQTHPIDTILHKKSLKEIRKQMKLFPTIFESVKIMMGNHYIPTPITYICKDKSLVNAIAYNKINWRDKTVSSKIKFLLNE